MEIDFRVKGFIYKKALHIVAVDLVDVLFDICQ